MSKIVDEMLKVENPPSNSKEIFTPRLSNVRKEHFESQNFGRRYDTMRERDSNPFHD